MSSLFQGTGKKHLEKQIEQLEIQYPDKARGVAKFNASLAHKIIAGADYMLITSRFEPCGLIQLQAQRYGTVIHLIPLCNHILLTFQGSRSNNHQFFRRSPLFPLLVDLLTLSKKVSRDSILEASMLT